MEVGEHLSQENNLKKGKKEDSIHGPGDQTLINIKDSEKN